MRRVAVVALVLLLAVAAAGCGGGEDTQCVTVDEQVYCGDPAGENEFGQTCVAIRSGPLAGRGVCGEPIEEGERP